MVVKWSGWCCPLIRRSEFESRWFISAKFVFEKNENKQKEAGVGPFFKKIYILIKSIFVPWNFKKKILIKSIFVPWNGDIGFLQGYLGSSLSGVDGGLDSLPELGRSDEEQVSLLVACHQNVVLVLALLPEIQTWVKLLWHIGWGWPQIVHKSCIHVQFYVKYIW